MNIGDLLSNKIVQILIALFIGISLLVYKYNLLEVIWPEKSNIIAIDQNNKDITIHDDTTALKDTIELSIDAALGD